MPRGGADKGIPSPLRHLRLDWEGWSPEMMRALFIERSITFNRRDALPEISEVRIYAKLAKVDPKARWAKRMLEIVARKQEHERRQKATHRRRCEERKKEAAA